MISYKEAEWLKLVELARSDRECSPVEDEAIVWAADRIDQIEAEKNLIIDRLDWTVVDSATKAIRIDELKALAIHMFLDHEKRQHFQISTYEKAEKLLGLKHEASE